MSHDCTKTFCASSVCRTRVLTWFPMTIELFVSFVTTKEPFVVGTRDPMTSESFLVTLVKIDEVFVVGTRCAMTDGSVQFHS